MTSKAPKNVSQPTTRIRKAVIGGSRKMITGVSRICLFALLVSFTLPLAAEVVIYPGHKPGELAQFSNLWESQRYAVSVNGKPLTVYASKNRTGINEKGKQISKGYITEAHFCYFSFINETVTVEIKSPNGAADMSHATVHPLRHNIPCQAVKGKASFKLSSPRKIVIKMSDDELYPLIILADTPDKNIPSGPNVTRYGPGIHDIGLKSPIRSGQTIYIDGGAIVKGTFFAPIEITPINEKGNKGKSNKGEIEKFTLRGRGILYGGDYKYFENNSIGNHLIHAQCTDGSLIEGCVLLDSAQHNMWVYSKSKVENVKIIAFHGNTDGVHLGPDSTCRDCFVMTNDDSLLGFWVNPKGTSALIEDCVVWQHNWGSPFKLQIPVGSAFNKNPQVKPSGAKPLAQSHRDGFHDYTWRNIDVLESGGGAVFQAYGGGYQGGMPEFERMGKISGDGTYNLVFENIYIERMRPKTKLMILEARGYDNAKMYNITFKNVYAPVANGWIRGFSDTSCVDGILFENMVINGKKITSLKGTNIEVGEHVKNITVK